MNEPPAPHPLRETTSRGACSLPVLVPTHLGRALSITLVLLLSGPLLFGCSSPPRVGVQLQIEEDFAPNLPIELQPRLERGTSLSLSEGSAVLLRMTVTEDGQEVSAVGWRFELEPASRNRDVAQVRTGRDSRHILVEGRRPGVVPWTISDGTRVRLSGQVEILEQP